MATLGMNNSWLKHQLSDVSDSPLSKRRKDENHLTSCLQLKNPVWRTATLEDTIYKDCPIVVYGWGKFYLKKNVNMKVFGVVQDFSSKCVLMTCEDNQVYAYDGEKLHLVASSMKQLDEGIKYPGSKTYCMGEAMDMTKDDWTEMKTDPLGKMLDKEYEKLVAERKDRLLANLKQNRKQTLKSC